jgi:DNA-binding transcriptional LysR family regulator
MDIKALMDFVTLTQVANFSRAAELRNLSQSAFSRRIQTLEQWLGTRLVDRNVFPLRLTAEGEKFEVVARAVVQQLTAIKDELGAPLRKNDIRVAMPYAIATSRFPAWWKVWNESGRFTCTLEVGSTSEIVAALTEALVDILICFDQESDPIVLESSIYERIVLGHESVRPFASQGLIEKGGADIPGTLLQPVPLLAYAPEAYFATLIDTVVREEGIPFHGYRAFQSDMTEVLADLASKDMGIAWLPDDVPDRNRSRGLVALGDGRWDIDVSIVAFKSRRNESDSAATLWKQLLDFEDARS